MYQLIDNTLTVNDWIDAGLTWNQFKKDSCNGFLNIFRCGINGNTLIDVKSIRRLERLRVIKGAYGPIANTDSTTGHNVVVDSEALSFFCSYCYESDKSLPENITQQYYNEASIFKTLKSVFEKQRNARAKAGKRIRMNEWWSDYIKFCKKQQEQFPHALPINVRSFERKYRAYLEDGYTSLIHKNYGTAHVEKLNELSKDWVIAHWASNINKYTLFQLFMEYNERAVANGWEEITPKCPLGFLGSVVKI